MNHSVKEESVKEISPKVMVACVIGLVAFIVFLAYRTIGPSLVPKTVSVREQREWVTKLAQDTQGDFSRLSPDDQKKVNGISSGNGATYLRAMYERQK